MMAVGLESGLTKHAWGLSHAIFLFDFLLLLDLSQRKYTPLATSVLPGNFRDKPTRHRWRERPGLL